MRATRVLADDLRTRETYIAVSIRCDVAGPLMVPNARDPFLLFFFRIGTLQRKICNH